MKFFDCPHSQLRTWIGACCAVSFAMVTFFALAKELKVAIMKSPLNKCSVSEIIANK